MKYITLALSTFLILAFSCSESDPVPENSLEEFKNYLAENGTTLSKESESDFNFDYTGDSKHLMHLLDGYFQNGVQGMNGFDETNPTEQRVNTEENNWTCHVYFDVNHCLSTFCYENTWWGVRNFYYDDGC